jgi:putative membrane protein
MSLNRPRRETWLAAVGVVVLAAAWLGPLPALSRHVFSAHMLMHMAVGAVACPLLAAGIAGGRFDLTRMDAGRTDRTRGVPWRAALYSPFVASALEFVVVWSWHAPGLHHLARQANVWLVIEQGSFLFVGTLVWLTAFGGDAAARRERAAAGIAALLMTSMHMTLLGVLLALAARPLYVHGATANLFGLSPLQDQHLGGVVMLTFGGASYMAGALWLLARLLREQRVGTFDG